MEDSKQNLGRSPQNQILKASSYICSIPQFYQEKIKLSLIGAIGNDRKAIQKAMNSRICDLEEVININLI